MNVNHPAGRYTRVNSPRLEKKRTASRKRFRGKMQTPAFTRRVPPSLLASGFNSSHVFFLEECMEGLLCGVQALTRNGMLSPSDMHFIVWFHSSKLQMCLFLQGKEKEVQAGQETARPGVPEAAVQMGPGFCHLAG